MPLPLPLPLPYSCDLVASDPVSDRPRGTRLSGNARIPTAAPTVSTRLARISLAATEHRVFNAEFMGRRIVDLRDVRADGWFDRLGEGAPRFRDLCEVVGEKVVAFAIIAGVRITAVAVERRHLDASLVSFTLGEGAEEHQLPLGELRHRLGASLSASEDFPSSLADDPTPEDLQRYLGYRYLLLAPLFGIGLRELHVHDDGPSKVLVDLGGAADLVAITELRELIRDRVRAESRGPRPTTPPFSIDLDLIPQAHAANESRKFERTVELLGGWPGPLSVLLRTAEGQSLTPEVRAALARALGLLGTAHAELSNPDWAEEVLRLAIQWGQEAGGTVTADLFRRLGEAQIRRGRHGPAIGLLQRSLGLGGERRVVLPLLARAFVARERFLAAALCAEEARALGAKDAELDTLFTTATRSLGEPWSRFRAAVPAPKVVPTVAPEKVSKGAARG